MSVSDCPLALIRLLRYGADIAVTDVGGKTARQWAEERNHPGIVALLDRWDGGAAKAAAEAAKVAAKVAAVAAAAARAEAEAKAEEWAKAHPEEAAAAKLKAEEDALFAELDERTRASSHPASHTSMDEALERHAVALDAHSLQVGIKAAAADKDAPSVTITRRSSIEITPRLSAARVDRMNLHGGRTAHIMLSFDDRPYCAYMCHTQDTGGAQTGLIANELRERYGMCTKGEAPGPWLDKWVPSCDALAMEKGISESKVLFIMMTKGIMSKPYPIMEMRWAKMYGLPIIGVMDKSGEDFIYDELKAAPEDLKGLLENVEYIPYRTKAYEQTGMIDEILLRGKLQVPTDDAQAAVDKEATRVEVLLALVLVVLAALLANNLGFIGAGSKGEL